MGNLFVGGNRSTSQPMLNGIQVTQSTYGTAVPLVYGQTRIPGTLIWYGAFTATPVNSGSGGKGGGGGGVTSYNYAASFQMMLCEGPINGVSTTYADKALHVGALALSDFNFSIGYGGVGQAVWPYMATNFPSQALGYSSTAWLGAPNYSLGGSASMPNLTFEVQGLLWSNLSAPYKTPTGTGTFTGTVVNGSNLITGISSITGPGIGSGSALPASTAFPSGCTILMVVGTTATVSVNSVYSGSGALAYTATGGDIDPASTLVDYCTAPTYGCAFPYLNSANTLGVTGYIYISTTSGSPIATFQPATGTFQGTTTIGSNVISGITSFTGTFGGGALCPGTSITGTGISAGTTAGALLPGTSTSVLMSAPATASGTVTVSYSSVVPEPRTMPVGTRIDTCTPFPSGANTTTSVVNATTVTMDTNASTTGTYALPFYVSSWQAYCIAQGFYVSVSESSQRAAQDFITELMTITNSDCIWSGGSLKVIPLADSQVSNNYATYTPNNGAGGPFTQPIFDFVDDDYIYEASDEPVVVNRKGVSDTFNKVRIEFLDRGNSYNIAVAEAFDASDIAINGERPKNSITLHNICDATVARRTAQYILQRQLYYKNTYQFKLRGDYCLLEPLDVIGITDTGLNISNALVRIDSVEIDDHDVITIDCTELPFGPGQTPLYNYQFGSRTGINTNVTPPSVNTPYIFSAPPLLVSQNGGYEIWIAVNGAANWGGAIAYMSMDNVNYSMIGNISAPATYGVTSSGITAVADPDSTNTLQVTLSNGGTLNASSSTEADHLRSLFIVDLSSPEIMSYGTGTLVSAGVYNLTYLRRNLYGTANAAHGSSVAFIKLDSTIFRVPYDPGMAGMTVYFKFCSVNQYQMNVQALSSATAYSYTIPYTAGQNASIGVTWVTNGPYTVIGSKVAKSQAATGSWTDGYAATKQAFPYGCCVTARLSMKYVNGGTANDLMLGLTTTPVANYTSLNFSMNMSGATLWYAYESGVAYNLGVVPQVNDIIAILWDGNIVRYYINGAIVRAVKYAGAALYAQVSLYRNGSSLDNVSMQAVSTQQVQNGNFLNTWSWKVGATGSQGNYIDSESGHTGSIVLGGVGSDPLGPYGQSETLWRGNSPTSGAQNGGWDNYTDIQGIDPNKSYRSCLWFKYTGTLGGSTYLYFGCSTNSATNNLSGTVNTTPYFIATPLSGLTVGKWYLMVGVIHGSSFGTTAANLGGLFDPTTGINLLTGTTAQGGTTEYKQVAGNTTQMMRSYNYGNTSGTLHGYWCRPRFEEITGQEPSISTLLSPAGALAYLNQADTANIVTNAASVMTTYSDPLASGLTVTLPTTSGTGLLDQLVNTYYGYPVAADISFNYIVSWASTVTPTVIQFLIYLDGSLLSGAPIFDVYATQYTGSSNRSIGGICTMSVPLGTLSATGHTISIYGKLGASGSSGALIIQPITNVVIKTREIKR